MGVLGGLSSNQPPCPLSMFFVILRFTQVIFCGPIARGMGTTHCGHGGNTFGGRFQDSPSNLLIVMKWPPNTTFGRKWLLKGILVGCDLVQCTTAFVFVVVANPGVHEFYLHLTTRDTDILLE